MLYSSQVQTASTGFAASSRLAQFWNWWNWLPCKYACDVCVSWSWFACAVHAHEYKKTVQWLHILYEAFFPFASSSRRSFSIFCSCSFSFCFASFSRRLVFCFSVSFFSFFLSDFFPDFFFLFSTFFDFFFLAWAAKRRTTRYIVSGGQGLMWIVDLTWHAKLAWPCHPILKYCCCCFCCLMQNSSLMMPMKMQMMNWLMTLYVSSCLSWFSLMTFDPCSPSS